MPPVTSSRKRDRLRRRLFETAARAVKTGHRLVLLVDGLDEDCGSHLGLVTASGGGLKLRDLHALTGRPIFEIVG